MNETINLWHDRNILGGMDILKASCHAYRYDPHAHDFFVIAAFSAGAQKHRIAGKNGVAVPGSVMIIPPGEVHTGESAIRDIGWDYSAFYPNAATLDHLSQALFGKTRGSLDFGTSFLIEDKQLSAHLLLAADVAYRSMDLLKRQETVYNAFEMLIRRYGQWSGHDATRRITLGVIERSLDYIRDNLSQRLSIEDIAEKVQLSEFHFMRLFKLHMNMTVHQYVTFQRLEKAKSMLVRGAPSATVAAAVGFYDQSHFTGHFRKVFGLTPRKYAKACR